MDNTIKNWIKGVNYNHLREIINSRKIAIWGGYAGGKTVKNSLQMNNLMCSYYIDAHKEELEYDNLPIINPMYGLDKQDIFILVAVVGVRKEIQDYLDINNFEEGTDYIYISKCIPKVSIVKCSGKYSDNNGNCIEFLDDEIECEIEFVGYNNRVSIGKGFEATRESKILVENGGKVIIGDYVRINKEVSLEAINGGELKIGSSNVIYKGTRICSKGSLISFGHYVSIGERFLCINGGRTDARIVIGNDCMFANDVSIILGGHSIFDMERKCNVSIENEKGIILGNHIWLGKNVTVLHGTRIGDGCIVGANSLVNRQVDNNCVIAGNPAKIIHTKYTWDRRNNIEWDELL